MSKNILLINVQAIKDRSAVHANVEDKLILPEIKVAQDTEIMPALGSALFRRMQEGITANDLNNDEQVLLNDYIADALVWFVVAAIPITGSYQTYTKGTVRKSSENTELPSMNDLLKLAEMYKNRAENYRERLIRYLVGSADKYPQYNDCGCGDYGDNVSPGRSGYSTQMWLGD